MSHPVSWLADNVRNAVEKCGALGASVYVPTPWNATAPGILVHVGSAPPLPEMASMEAAVAFAGDVMARDGAAEDKSGAQPAVVPSALLEGCLIPVPLLATLRARMNGHGADIAGPLRRLSDRQGGAPIVGWLGLRFAGPAGLVQHPDGWHAVLELAGALASTYVCFYGILTDPVTGLPGRAELNGTLRAELDRAQANALPFSLLLVKLENLDDVNARLGRQAGDALLREFLEAVHGSIRSSDTVMRYGGAIFALPLRDVTPAGAVILGEKIRRRIAARAFLDGTLAVHCAVGVASWEPADAAPLQALDLLRRVDQALSFARREGCTRAVLWCADGNMASVEQLDPLLGVFTGQAERDYRNMRLLWDVGRALSSTSGSDLAHAVVARMFSLFSATRAALFERAADGLRLSAGQQRADESDAVAALTRDDIGADEWRLNEDGLASLAAQHRHLEMAGSDGAAAVTGVAVPLVIDGLALGTLYLMGGSDVLKVDRSDLPVLESVAAHLALALDRERLAATERLREQQEQQRLKAELHSLRTVLRQASFVFRSKPMGDLLNTARRVAPTEATVLITGESGTGKEMLAHALHELSGRRDRPLVIVDCGAIPVSLMDSELFGRERGAYTGAERRAAGRLAQADGGTVFLDEIGELPLEVQSKLLRFVQEKTITMIGATRAQKVDVRIIAATNRALEDEVRAGRFREDLFHRLNVVRLRIPPLRERPDDVVFLARHFLQAFASEHAKGVRGLEPDAERLLQAYDWPGNVRELQNTMLQAVVLAEGDMVTPDDLQLSASAGPPSIAGRAVEVTPRRAAASDRGPDADLTAAAPPFEAAWQTLVDRLAEAVALAAASGGGRLGSPVGKWLARDLVLEAHEQAGRVASRAAACVGLAETTFSRRLRQAEADAASTRQPESWNPVQSALSALLRASGRPPGNLADRIDDCLFGIVIAAVPDNLPQAASLIGISVPTLKRRLAGVLPRVGQEQRTEPHVSA